MGGYTFMDINTSIKLNKKFEEEPHNQDIKTIASGWVAIDEIIKFPVNVRRYMDKATNREKMFVSYPQRKKADGTYEDIVKPASKEIRAEVESEVLKAVRHEITKGFNFPEISNVRVNLLRTERNVGKVNVKAMASISINGFNISGITVKEGERGLFVQMPQYESNGTYRDTVYGLTTMVQTAIKDCVLFEYNKKITNPQVAQPVAAEKQEPSSKDAISKVKITNFDFKETGYLNFIIHTEGEQLKSRFRIYDSKFDDTEQLKLLYVENADKHTNISVLWDTLEESIKERMVERYNKLKEENEKEFEIPQDNPFDNPDMMRGPRM